MFVLVAYIGLSIFGWWMTALGLLGLYVVSSLAKGGLIKTVVFFLLLAGGFFWIFPHGDVSLGASDDQVVPAAMSELLVADYDRIPQFASDNNYPLATYNISSSDHGWTFWDPGDGSWNKLSSEEQQKVEIRREASRVIMINQGNQTEDFTIYIGECQDGKFDNRFTLQGQDTVPIKVNFYNVAGQGMDEYNPDFAIDFNYGGWQGEKHIRLGKDFISYPNGDGRTEQRTFQDFYPDQNDYQVYWVVTLEPGQRLDILDFGAKDSLW